MPRMQLYLPDDLYREVKLRKLPASEILQEAMRNAIHRQDLLEATDQYLKELAARVGEPTADEWAEAEALAARVREHYESTRQQEVDTPTKKAS